MASEAVLPVEIVIIGDDDHQCEDNNVSVLYATPTISRKRGTNTADAISVEEYAEDRDLKLAIMASLLPTQSSSHSREGSSRTKRVVIDLSKDNTFYLDHGVDDDLQVLNSFKSSGRTRRPLRGVGPSIWERGEFSGVKPSGDADVVVTFTCEICVDTKPYSESFSIMGCTHKYCADCMVRYVSSKLQDNITQIQCPVSDCKGLLEPEHCHSILPPEVFDRWGNSLCEALILASEKFYCPFKDCSALLIDDEGVGNGGKPDITQSECPNCWRLFCAQCKVPWHSDISCSEFQKLKNDEREREDIMLMNLAKTNKWMRCPRCRYYVEKSQGCLFIRCRCGYTFCYNCGAYLMAHYCTQCKR